MSRFSLSNIAYAATTSELNKDLQDDKERYTTRHRNKKRDMAFHPIAVSHLNSLHSPAPHKNI